MVESRQNIGASRLNSADQFDDDIGTRDESFRVRREKLRINGRIARCRHITDRNSDQVEARTRACRKIIGLHLQQPCHLGADSSTAEQPNFDFVHICPINRTSTSSTP